MSNWQAFWRGYWSFFEIRPFGEKPSFHPLGEEKRFDYEQLLEELKLDENVSVWDSVGGYFNTVGGYLYNAMGKIDEELEKNDRNTQTGQET